MYVHKYTTDGDIFYRVSAKSAKPGRSVSLMVENWRGNATGSVIENALKILSEAKFTRETPEKVPKEPSKKEPEETEEKKKDKKASIFDYLKSIALCMNGID